MPIAAALIGPRSCRSSFTRWPPRHDDAWHSARDLGRQASISIECAKACAFAPTIHTIRENETFAIREKEVTNVP
jgi:hypothetical protein